MFVPKLVIRLVSILVPASRRDQWIAEWEAELDHELLLAEVIGFSALVGVTLH